MPALDSNARSTTYRLASWAGAILITALGIYLSLIRFMDHEWLTRAGCLVVMLGIWSGIGGILQERLLFSRTKWRRKKAIAAAKARLVEQNVGLDDAEKHVAEINDVLDKQMAEAAQNIRLSIGILEVSLLLTGTFLWGFGDLLV